MPEFMTEWWFLGLMLGLLCALTLAIPLLLIVVLVVLPRYRRGGRTETGAERGGRRGEGARRVRPWATPGRPPAGADLGERAMGDQPAAGRRWRRGDGRLGLTPLDPSS